MENDTTAGLPPASRPGRGGHPQRLAEKPYAKIAHALLLLGATGAVSLAAGVPAGSAGVFLICAGAALILCPPAIRVERSLWLAAAGLILCACLAFLPAHWFPAPGWRTALESLPIVPLPSTLTPVPWQTAFWVALLASTALAGLFLLAQPLRSRALLFLALTAVVICAASGGLAIYARTTGWHYPFAGKASFGFFPNRNHTATFLITGSIVAIGILGVTLRDRSWLAAGLAAGCLTTCVVSLFLYSGSRGGIVFLLAGTLLWIAGLGRKHRHGRLLVSYLALLVAGATFFLVCGGEARSRLTAFFEHGTPVGTTRPGLSIEKVDGEGNVSNADDATFKERLLIYEDTLPLIRAFPLTGTGLGAFAMVFPQYRSASLSERRVIHPESDWLMLAAEAGLPALFCLLTLVWLLGRRLRGFQEHPYWPLRWGCVAAAVTAVLHGLVDVPVHHVSLGWWIMVLAGLGLQPGTVEAVRRSPSQHGLFVSGGVAMFILGFMLIRSEWFGANPFPPFAEERMQAEIVRHYRQHDNAAASRLNRAAIAVSPFANTFYFQLGAFELPFADSDAEVDAAFKAQRLLEPNFTNVPLRQGDAWIHYDSARTAALWLEALSRQQRLDRVTRAGSALSLNFYRDLLGRSARWPDVQQRLLAGTQNRSEYVLIWLETARPELVRNQLEGFSKNNGFVQNLDAAERLRFLLVWYAVGDREELVQLIDNQVAWQKVAWPIRLRQWVDAQDFERAVHEASTHYGISLALPAPGGDKPLADSSSPEPRDPVEAFNTYWREGNTLAAHRVLEEATLNSSQPAPEIWRLKAAEAAQKANWPAAWQSLERYIRLRNDG